MGHGFLTETEPFLQLSQEGLEPKITGEEGKALSALQNSPYRDLGLSIDRKGSTPERPDKGSTDPNASVLPQAGDKLDICTDSAQGI